VENVTCFKVIKMYCIRSDNQGLMIAW